MGLSRRNVRLRDNHTSSAAQISSYQTKWLIDLDRLGFIQMLIYNSDSLPDYICLFPHFSCSSHLTKETVTFSNEVAVS